LSASSLSVADLCLARWEAEQFNRAPGFSGNAAQLGSAVHGGLELYVKTNIQPVPESQRKESLEDLIQYYKMSYMSVFGTTDLTGDLYEAGLEMVTNWFKRTSFAGVEVISVEAKTTFLIPTSAGEIPFNYIFDRFDKLSGDEVYRVVDYKSSVWGKTPSELKKTVQARIYGLMAQIQQKQAKKIWVEFDMLRHDPVGIVFTRDDNIATWNWIKAQAEKIIATPEGKAPETLNPECRFCVRKASCTALTKNAAVGGIFSLSRPEVVDRRAELEFQAAAIVAAINEIDTVLLAEMKDGDIKAFESDMNRIKVSVSRRRGVDAERVEQVVGAELFGFYGGKKLTMEQFGKLLKDKTLTDEQRAALQGLVGMKIGEPKIKVESKASIEAEVA
jgi:hypothetical protein